MSTKKKKANWTEFECPECDAHNPWDIGFTYRDELFCAWCGAVFIVRKVASDEDKYKLVLY